MKMKRICRIGRWVFLLALTVAVKVSSVGSAESIRPVFLQVPSIDTGTSLLLLYGKRWDLFKQEGLESADRRRKTERRHGDSDLRGRAVQRSIPVVLLLRDSWCAGPEFHGH